MEQTSECCILLWARCLDEVREISVRLRQIVDLLPCQRAVSAMSASSHHWR